MDCKVLKVLAPDGSVSKLYSEISGIVSNADEALRLYLSLESEGFRNFTLQANGEPLLSDVLDDLDISDHLKARYYAEEPVLFALPPGSEFAAHRQGAPEKLPIEIEGRVIELEKQIMEAKRKADATTKEDLKNFFEGQAQELTREKNYLLEVQTQHAILTVAGRQLTLAKNLANKPYVSFQQLKYAADLARSWQFDITRDYLTQSQLDPDNLTNLMFQDLSGSAEAIHTQVLNIVRKNFRESITERRGEDPGDLTKMREISRVTQFGYDMSHFRNPVAQEIDSAIKRAERAPAGRMTEIHATLKDLSKGIDIKKLFQRNQEGKIIHALVSPYSATYHSKINYASRRLADSIQEVSRLAPAQSGPILTRAFRSYYKERNKFEIPIDVRYFLDDKHVTSRYKTKKQYLAFLENQFGKELTAEYIEKAEVLADRFEKERDIARLRIQGEALRGEVELHGDKPADFIERRLKDWDLVNSPQQYLKEFSNPRLSVYHNREGWRYVLRIPRTKHHKDGSPTTHYDKNFELLTSSERKLLDYIIDTMTEMKNYLPRDVRDYLPPNFVPFIQKKLLEEFQEGGMSSAVKKMKLSMFEAMTGEEVLELTETSAVGRELQPEIDPPVHYTKGSNFEESIDLVRLVNQFSSMALNYKVKSEIEDRVRLGQAIIEDASRIIEKGRNPLYDRIGKLLTSKEGLPNLKSGVRYGIEAGIKGEKRLAKEGESGNPIYSANFKENRDKKRKARAIRRKRDKLELDLEEGRIVQKEYSDEIAVLEEEYRELGGKNLVYGAFFEGILAYAQLKGMAFNVTAGLTNLSWGILSNFIHAASNQDFNDKQLFQAMSMIMKGRLKTRSAEDTKLAQLVMRYNILFEVTEIGYGKKNERQRLKMLSYIKNPYEIQRRTEFIIQGMSMVAQMLNTSVTDLQGVERTLFDAYLENGKWNEAEFGSEEDAGWDSLHLDGNTENNFTRFRDKVIQVNKQLHGNYDPASPILAKKYILGRALLMFRSWVAEGIAWRFQQERWDDQMRRNVKGRYITAWDVAREHGLFSIPKALFNVQFGKDIEFEGEPLSALDLANFKSLLRELQILLALVVAGILVKLALADEDDDDEWTTWGGRMLLTQIYRVQQDLQFYTGGDGLGQVLTSPIPAYNAAKSAISVMWSGYDYLVDPEYSGTDLVDKFTRNVPYINQVYRLYNQAVTEVDDESKILGREILN